MGSYCACPLSWPLPELSIRDAGQKDCSSGDGNVPNDGLESRRGAGGGGGGAERWVPARLITVYEFIVLAVTDQGPTQAEVLSW